MLLYKSPNIIKLIYIFSIFILVSFSLKLKKNLQVGNLNIGFEVAHQSANKNSANPDIHFSIINQELKLEKKLFHNLIQNVTAQESAEDYESHIKNNMDNDTNKNSNDFYISNDTHSNLDHSKINNYILDYENKNNFNLNNNHNNLFSIDSVTNSNIQFNQATNKNTSETKDFYYTPQIGGIQVKNQLPATLGINCVDCVNPHERNLSPSQSEREKKDSLNFKLPNEDKWVSLESVTFVKEISPASKAQIEIENIAE